MITTEILLESGAQIKTLKKGDFLFLQGGHAKFYFQLISGEVKMNNYNENGKEFIQGIFKTGDSFGEPPLFLDILYPANAQATKDSQVLSLGKDLFLDLVQNDTQISFQFLKTFAGRLYYKSIIAVEISTETAQHRVLSLLNYLKKYTLESNTKNNLCKITLTRQEIANLTGLRVETVIRSIKELKEKGCIKIINRKIYLNNVGCR